MHAIVDGIMEKLGKEDGDEESESEEKDDSSSEDAEEMEVEEKKESKPARTILRAKRKTPAANVEKPQPVKRSTRSKARPTKKAKDSESEDDEEMDESEDEGVKSLAQPMFGKKRKHPATGPFKDTPLASKRVKRNSDGSETVKTSDEPKAPKKKAASKKPPVFKAGKENPSTVIVENEIEKHGKFAEPEFSCCNLCNLKNLHRAVNTNDHKLLEKLVFDKKHIAHMMMGWSVDDKTTLLDKILLKGSTELLGALFPNKGWIHEKQFKIDP